MMDVLSQTAKAPMIRTKRAHKKVRSGCATCKQARVKCDEARPLCSRCHRKKLECAYAEGHSISLRVPEHIAVKGRDDLVTPLSEQRLAVLHDKRAGTADGDPHCGIKETEFAKHFFTHTVHTFADCGMTDTWRAFMPAVALNCPVVRQGMLTLSAMCLHHDHASAGPEDFPLNYLRAAEAFGNRFVEESRQKIKSFQKDQISQDKDSVLACSRLLCVLGFAFLRTHRRNGATLTDPRAWTWLHLLRGVKPSYDLVVQASLPVDEAIVQDMTPKLDDSKSMLNICLGRKHIGVNYVHQSRQQRFDALQTSLYVNWNFLTSQELQDMKDAIEVLAEVTEQSFWQQGHCLVRSFCVWPARVSKGFIDMLTRAFPPALAVYTHWLMLMVLLEDLWFINEMGPAGIRDAVALCADATPDVRNLLVWPQHMLKLTQ